MKKLIYPFALFALLLVQVGCESHHKDELQEQQQDTAQAPETQIEAEHGGNAGNR